MKMNTASTETLYDLTRGATSSLIEWATTASPLVLFTAAAVLLIFVAVFLPFFKTFFATTLKNKGGIEFKNTVKEFNSAYENDSEQGGPPVGVRCRSARALRSFKSRWRKHFATSSGRRTADTEPWKG